jgi:hypothetical protein
MKKIFSLFSALCLFVGFSFANEPLDLDQNQISKEFEGLVKVENFINANDGMTLEKLKQENSQIIEGVNLAETTSVSAVKGGDLPGNIPPFVWGCVLSWVGLILVYVLTDKDSAMTKKALIGCLVNGVVWIVYYFVIVGSVFRAATVI